MTDLATTAEVPQHSHAAADIDRSQPVFRRLLVPLDTSPLSERVLELAADVAIACGSEVEFLRVLDASARTHELLDPLDWEQERAGSDTYLREIAARFRARGITVHVQTEFGSPAEEILRVARAREVSLIALATHGSGRGTHWSLGSTASKVIERAPCSVLVVPSDWQSRQGRGLRVLVPVDGSLPAESAFPVATRIAAHGAGELVLVHVVQEPQVATRTVPSDEERRLIERLRGLNAERARIYLAEVRERVAQEVDSVDVRALAASSPAIALLDLVEELQTDLVVIAAHGRNFDATCRFGCTTARMLANLRCPTLVIVGTEDPQRAARWSGSYVSVGNSDRTPPTGVLSV